MVAVFREDLDRLVAAAGRMTLDLAIQQAMELLPRSQGSSQRRKMLCLADFSPKNLLADAGRWTLTDLESAMVAPTDVFWAKAAINAARDTNDPMLALEQASWFWCNVASEPLGRATVVWALARMLYFRAIVTGPLKDPTSALEKLRDRREVPEALAALVYA